MARKDKKRTAIKQMADALQNNNDIYYYNKDNIANNSYSNFYKYNKDRTYFDNNIIIMMIIITLLRIMMISY